MNSGNRPGALKNLKILYFLEVILIQDSIV